jgi:hypothetical protein
MNRVCAPFRPQATSRRTLQLGELLHDHVRVEERELFEEIERIAPASELERLGL